MGTNFYTKTNTCPTCGHKPEGVHLGKSSAGWEFTFQYNGGQYYKDVKEMKRWMKDKEIENEYGDSVSHKEFWDMVKRKKKEGSHHEYTKHSGHFYVGEYYFIDSDFS